MTILWYYTLLSFVDEGLGLRVASTGRHFPGREKNRCQDLEARESRPFVEGGRARGVYVAGALGGGDRGTCFQVRLHLEGRGQPLEGFEQRDGALRFAFY